MAKNSGLTDRSLAQSAEGAEIAIETRQDCLNGLMTLTPA